MNYRNAVSVRLSPKDRKEIGNLIDDGYAISITDYVRSAIREKIARDREQGAGR